MRSHLVRLFIAWKIAAVFAILLLALYSCHKYDDSCLVDIINRLDNLEAKTKDGVLIKSVTQIPGTPGGWRIEFTGGEPSTIDILNGAAPLVEVRQNPDGSISIWLDNGSGPKDTGIDLTGGANGVSPKIEVRKNIDGTVTIWYNVTNGYPTEGWINTGVDLGMSANDSPLLGITNNEAAGTVTFTLNDLNTYTFPKAYTAVRFEILTTSRVEVPIGGTNTIRFVVNPSTVWIPTGNTSESLVMWELNNVETRTGYVNISQNFEITSIMPSGAGEGEYIATIGCKQHTAGMTDYVLALVLNTNSDTDPILVSSAPFIFGIVEITTAPSANSYIVAPNGSVTFGLGQIADEVSAGFRATPRVSGTDDVTMELLWTDRPELLTEVAPQRLTPANSGIGTVFQVNTGSTEGNAVVAAKVNGSIVWSWHIWVTSYDPAVANKPFAAYNGVSYPTSEAEPDANRDLVFMDRNLGALNAIPDDLGAMGMLYQWGRKDPFPANWQGFAFMTSITEPTIYTPAEPMGTASGVIKISADIASGTDYAVQNPLTFIYQGASDDYYSWYSTTAAGPRSLWVNVSGTGTSATATKTVYDPCPAGWRIPAEGGHRVIHGSVTETGGWLGNNVAINGSYFPYVSFRMHIDGMFDLWTPVSVCWFGQTYFDLYTFNLATQTTSPQAYQALGVPVRCVRIE